MPYIEEENRIFTKVLGVASRIDESDELGVRQVILDEIADDPSIVSLIYLRQREVWVSLENGNEYCLGTIREAYNDLIMSHVTRIKSWEVTGGHVIPKRMVEIAGQSTGIGQVSRAKRGLNIQIELF
jgi:hypothetical protein